MPQIESGIIALLASVASVFVQASKNLVPDSSRDWIAPALLFLLTLVGLGLSFYYGRDPVVGVLEGFFGGATALGFYEGASAIPGVNRVFNGKGWIGNRNGGA